MSIRMKNITKLIGEKTLFTLDHLTIEKGQKMGIIGANGSGKTTFLKLIAGEIKAEQGTIVLDGKTLFFSQFLADQERSGGEQMKQRIREIMLSDAEILLVDEPTNHLDRAGLAYLTACLQKFAGTVLIVSHQRQLLNAVCDQILLFEEGTVKAYAGNYRDYLAQKEVEMKEQQRDYANYQKTKKELESAVAMVKQKSKQVRKTPKRMGNSEARLHKMGDQKAKKVLDKKMNAIETRLNQLTKVAKPQQTKNIALPFLENQTVHNFAVLRAENYQLSRGQTQLLVKSEFQLLTGSKTALIGENGVGKSTLLQAIMARKSSFQIAANVRFSLFSQNFEQLDTTKTIFENVAQGAIYSEQEIRNFLAQLQFRGSSIFKEVGVLSGGERNKVALAKLLVSRANVLLLDEPTNHLDIPSLEVVEAALHAYQGTILFVSHDAQFVEKLATQRWTLTNQQILTAEKPPKESLLQPSKEELLLLENKKAALLSQLAFVKIETEKKKYEQELAAVLKRLKKRSTQIKKN